MKTKEIKDYLPFYLGCDVKDEYDDNIKKLHAVSLIDCMVKGRTYHDRKFEEIKPLLRPLSDIKNTEINEIASLILNEKTTCGRIDWTDDKDFVLAYWKKEESILPEYDFVEMGMHISNIGNPFRIDHVWNYIKGNRTGASHEILHNSHEITIYLLSKHFDLFGLIESGIAIDKTTLK